MFFFQPEGLTQFVCDIISAIETSVHHYLWPEGFTQSVRDCF